jgi:hypothetical protein
MRLNELLGRKVVTRDGRRLGAVRDALLVQDGPILNEFMAAFRVHALAVSRRGLGARLGYAQGSVQRPWLLRALLGRPPTMVPWDAIDDVEADPIVVDATRTWVLEHANSDDEPVG